MNRDKNKEIYENFYKRIRALSESFGLVLKNEKMRRFFQEQMELRKKISGIFSYFQTCFGIQV